MSHARALLAYDQSLLGSNPGRELGAIEVVRSFKTDFQGRAMPSGYSQQKEWLNIAAVGKPAKQLPTVRAG